MIGKTLKQEKKEYAEIYGSYNAELEELRGRFKP